MVHDPQVSCTLQMCRDLGELGLQVGRGEVALGGLSCVQVEGELRKPDDVGSCGLHVPLHAHWGYECARMASGLAAMGQGLCRMGHLL